MTNKGSAELIEAACNTGKLEDLAEEYIVFCHTTENEQGEATPKATAKKKSADKASKFPNIAGFCRYLGIGQQKYECLSQKYPEEFEKLSAIFEDEALNSEISASVLTAYMKKRLGYNDTEKSEKSEIDTGQIRLIFDHDILLDGE